jgi:hypothetical protein
MRSGRIAFVFLPASRSNTTIPYGGGKTPFASSRIEKVG